MQIEFRLYDGSFKIWKQVDGENEDGTKRLGKTLRLDLMTEPDEYGAYDTWEIILDEEFYKENARHNPGISSRCQSCNCLKAVHTWDWKSRDGVMGMKFSCEDCKSCPRLPTVVGEEE